LKHFITLFPPFSIISFFFIEWHFHYRDFPVCQVFFISSYPPCLQAKTDYCS